MLGFICWTLFLGCLLVRISFTGKIFLVKRCTNRWLHGKAFFALPPSTESANHGLSWYCSALARFLMPSDSAFVKKNNLRMSLAGFPSSIVTVEHSRVLDIILEKFLPPPHSSHLHMFRRQLRVSVKSSAIALDSRIRLNCVNSSKARFLIHARIDSQHCLSLFVLLTFSSTMPSKYFRWGEWFFTF